MKKVSYSAAFVAMLALSACTNLPKTEVSTSSTSSQKTDSMQLKVNEYVSVDLTTDISDLTQNQKDMLKLLMQAAENMNDLYWYQVYPEHDSLINATKDEATRKFIQINFGPWDRLRDDAPFIAGIGTKPKGANFYPKDMTKEEFEKADLPGKDGLYNFIRRDKDGKLISIPFHVQFKDQLATTADLLRQAAKLAKDEGFRKYLNLRADALVSDNFRASDLAWMDMKNNDFDIVIGPIETYEDQLFGFKASYESNILRKDKSWSERLAKYASYLPELQANLPVDAKYKQEKPGTDADLNAYDVLYYAGAANAGGKTIAINLPNDETVQLQKGTRRLQLKNVMKAKFDKIMVPIANVLITPEQRSHLTFDAFFANTMFHEVAHGLGIKNTITGKGSVRKALKEHASALEEGKADILGLYMVEQLINKGVIKGDIRDYYTTFIAGILRSVRFGAGDAHGVANMIRFNYFKEKGAFDRLKDGTYRVNYDKMREAIASLSNLILTLQGNGDYEAVNKLVKEKGMIKPELQQDLDRLKDKNIPLDIVFNQGPKVLGL